MGPLDSDQVVGSHPQEPQHLIILHTNDIHGQVLPLPATWLRDVEPKPLVGGLERIAQYIDKTRREAAANGSDVLVLEAGDWFQGTPEGQLGQGLPLMQIISRMGYDAVCVGNHEFDHGVEVLVDHLAAVEMRALLANVQEPNGRLLPGTEPYAIFERAGSRIAVVGLLSVETPSITHPSARQLTWNDEAETLRFWMRELQDDCDWILPLTHVGIEHDEALVAAVPGHPIVIGGHSHTLLRKGKRVGDTLIAQAGSKGRGIGRIDVWIDPATRQPSRVEAQVVNLFEDTVLGGVATDVSALCEQTVRETDGIMREVVGSIAQDMPREREPWSSSLLGNWITEVMLADVGGDIAVQNRGGIRANWKAGPITRRDVFSILPFDNTLVTLRMTGEELFQMFAERVAAGVTLELSGAILVLEATDDGHRLVDVELDGQSIERAKTYRFVTNNYLAGGGDGFDGLPLIADREDHLELHRDVVERALRGGKPIRAQPARRYRIQPSSN